MKETIRAEIERYEAGAQSAYNPHDEYADFFYGKVIACEDLLSILDTLPEQPVEGLEEEIEKRYEQAKWGYVDGFGETVMDKDQFTRIARHFAEWGAEHLKK